MNSLHTANDLQMILLYLQKLTTTELHGQNWTGTLCTVPCVGPKITIRQHQRSPYEFVLYSALSSETREKLLSEKQAEQYLLFTEKKNRFRVISCFLVGNVNTMVYKYAPWYIYQIQWY